MKEGIRIVSVLTLVCVVCALFLSVVASLAKEKIEYNQKEAIREALYTIQPAIATVGESQRDGRIIYTLFDAKDKPIGYGFLAEGQGYQGTIKIMAVVDAEFAQLIGIEIIESQETPGLGARIAEEFFKNQFKAKAIAQPLECTKKDVLDEYQIKAITGATISSRAVVNILNKEIEELRGVIKE